MKELRETIGMAAMVVLMPSIFLLISILLAMLYINNPIQDAFLLKFLFIDLGIMALSIFLIWILSDDVWDRRNLPDAERKRRFGLK